MNNSKTKRSWTPSPLETRVRHRVQRMAEREAARIPWPDLLKAQRQYVCWHAYVLWVRAIEETEESFPYWLGETVDQHARGFLRFAAEYGFHHRHAPYPETFWRMLQQWADERIFRKPWTEGWMDAVGFYAVRHLTSLRDDAYAEWCIKTWKRSKPASYRSFREWRKASEQVSDEVLDQVEMRDDRRELIKLIRRIRPRALDLAVDRYVGWEVFACWARPALEELRPLPQIVEKAVDDRCPGFLELHRFTPASRHIAEELMHWIDEHAFRAAKEQGWSKALRYQTSLHPRHLRAQWYWHDWVMDWTRKGRADYPPLEPWSRSLDAYTFEAGK